MLKHLVAFIRRPVSRIADRFPFPDSKNCGRTHHYLLTIALMGSALLLRLSIAPVSAGMPYVTFFPTGTLAAIVTSNCVHEMDTVARFGGDEFVVILSELDADVAESTSQAEIIAEKTRTVLSEPYLLKIKLDGETETTIEHPCTASIGIELFITRATTHDEILKRADIAMYQAKEDGRNLIRFYGSKV